MAHPIPSTEGPAHLVPLSAADLAECVIEVGDLPARCSFGEEPVVTVVDTRQGAEAIKAAAHPWVESFRSGNQLRAEARRYL